MILHLSRRPQESKGGMQRTCPAQRAPAPAPGLLLPQRSQPQSVAGLQCHRRHPALPLAPFQAAHQTAAPLAEPATASPAQMQMLRSCCLLARLLARPWAAAPPGAAACCRQQGRLVLHPVWTAQALPCPTSWPGMCQAQRAATRQPPVNTRRQSREGTWKSGPGLDAAAVQLTVDKHPSNRSLSWLARGPNLPV